MQKILIFISLAILSASTIMADITMNKDGSRGIADIYSAKTVKGGRLFFGISPNFTFDKVGVNEYNRIDEDGNVKAKNVVYTDFLDNDGNLMQRNTETFSYFAPIYLGYGWNDHSTTTLGLFTFNDAIDKYDDLSGGGVTELYLMQKFSLPTADTVFNVGIVGQLFYSQLTGSDGYISRWSEAHYKSTSDDEYRYQSLSARHSTDWALKVLMPLTIDISAKNPDVMLKFHLNLGGLYNNPANVTNTKIFGNIGAEFNPHQTFGLYTILNGGMRWQNMTEGHADIFKDDMSLDFGFSIKSPNVSFTAGAKKAISKSPTEAEYYVRDDDNKSYKSSLNSSLYTKETADNIYLINAPSPPEWTISTQLNFFIYLLKKDVDGDGIFDANDMCPQDPEDLDGFQDEDGCPEVDNDGDGINDLEDRCPNEVEDLDGFQDNDGCPEADNDNDGVLDNNDKCPGTDDEYIDSREDADGFQDSDGCADNDNDNDSIPDAVDKCPNQPEDKDGIEDTDGCPEGDKDADKDGIFDQNDKCPNNPEDRDGFEDNDGCPDDDNDKDGIPDLTDKCPGDDKAVFDSLNTKENYNGVEDTDGCPDGEADTDGDGILDPVDKCPKQAEDKDGFEDTDGCPDYDNDVDGIKDIADGCPGSDSTVAAGIVTKETFNGFEDVDGCPDEVAISKKPMKLNVYFESGSARLKRNSYTALDDLVTKMTEDEEAKIIVDGFTDSKGSFQSNERLSKRRANAVRTYLIKKGGISADRVKAVGMGEKNPVAENDTAEGRELNRRIEIRRQ